MATTQVSTEAVLETSEVERENSKRGHQKKMGLKADFSAAPLHPESLHWLLIQGSKTLRGRDN